MRAKAISAVFCVLIFLAPGLGGGSALAAPVYVLLTTAPVPPSADNSVGGAFTTYDIASVDGTTQLMYLADRSNA
jgi:hypothetical protein